MNFANFVADTKKWDLAVRPIYLVSYFTRDSKMWYSSMW